LRAGRLAVELRVDFFSITASAPDEEAKRNS
jgi:hypothetical protein